MLIKVDVDSGIVYNQCQAGKYAVNHCNNLEYDNDWYYPDDEQYPTLQNEEMIRLLTIPTAL